MTSPENGLPAPETPSQPQSALLQAGNTPTPARRGFPTSQMRATLATAAVVGLLGMASAPWLLASPKRMSWLVARALPALQADVQFGSVKLGWLGPLVFEDIHVVPRDGSSKPITITRVEVSHGLAGMLLSLGDLGRLRIEGLDANVVFDADRNSNFKGLFQLPPPPASADAAQPTQPQTTQPQTARRSPVRLQLEVAGAIVRISGPWSAEEWVSEPIHMRATLGPDKTGGWSEWNIEPVQLLTDARLEPAVAQGVLAYIAPLMADATRTGGRFSLRLSGARLPVGDPAAAQLSGVLSMHAVDLGPGPLVAKIIDSLPIKLPAPPSIRIADQSHVEFRLVDRRVWHTGLAFGLPLAKPGQRLDLRSTGSVGLDDKSLDIKLELPIPADLPQDRPLLATLAGRTFSLNVGGILGQPKVSFDGSIQANAGQMVAELMNRLRAAGGPPKPQSQQPQSPPPPAPGWSPEAAAAAADRPQQDKATASQKADEPSTADKIKSALPQDLKTDPAADAVIDLVGGVLGEVAKRRAERQAAEAANPTQNPLPRRGRFLRRLMQPEAPATPEVPATPQLQPVPE